MSNVASTVRPLAENVLSQCNICKENKFNCNNKSNDNKYENYKAEMINVDRLNII